jgi:hypothetical protein
MSAETGVGTQRQQIRCALRTEGSMKHGLSIWRAYAYAWITLGLFLFTLVGHWLFGWFAYVDEQQVHGQEVAVGAYAVQMMRDTLENWQSEFLQLLW